MIDLVQYAYQAGRGRIVEDLIDDDDYNSEPEAVAQWMENELA